MTLLPSEPKPPIREGTPGFESLIRDEHASQERDERGLKMESLDVLSNL